MAKIKQKKKSAPNLTIAQQLTQTTTTLKTPSGKKVIKKKKTTVVTAQSLTKKARQSARREAERRTYEAALRVADTAASAGRPRLAAKVRKPTVAMPATIGSVCALDCEYVGVGFQGKDDQLARVSIVNEAGDVVYDKYVKPSEPVTDYRTFVSGIQPGHLVNGLPFTQVQQEVHSLLADKIVVGHAVHNDFRVLNLTHPSRLKRDTAKYKPLRTAVGALCGAPSLKLLAEKVLGVRIQQGEHDSLIDARTSLRLYLLHRKKWDAQIKESRRIFP